MSVSDLSVCPLFSTRFSVKSCRLAQPLFFSTRRTFFHTVNVLPIHNLLSSCIRNSHGAKWTGRLIAYRRGTFLKMVQIVFMLLELFINCAIIWSSQRAERGRLYIKHARNIAVLQVRCLISRDFECWKQEYERGYELFLTLPRQVATKKLMTVPINYRNGSLRNWE